MSPSIQDRVLRVIATSKRLPLETVQPDSSFESLSIDSLDRLNILFDLESEFDIEIDDEDAKQVTGIPQMVAGITAILEAREAGLPAPHFPRAQQAEGTDPCGSEPTAASQNAVAPESVAATPAAGKPAKDESAAKAKQTGFEDSVAQPAATPEAPTTPTPRKPKAE